MFDLVSTTTEDNLELNGLFSPHTPSQPVVLHIHGFEGDFFTNRFIRVIAEELHKNAISFLTAQTRGIGSGYYFNSTKGDYLHYGSHFELLEDSLNDIEAWVTFLVEKGYNNIILQGHSLGTMKVIRYLFQGKQTSKIQKLILLAPFDNFALSNDASHGKLQEYVKIAREKISEGKGEEIIPKEYLDVPMSYKTYVSWHDENDFTHMFDFHNKTYSFPILSKIQIPVKVIVGTNDIYFHKSNPTHPQEPLDIMKKFIKNFDARLIDGAPHSYAGYESIVADEILSFIQK